MAPGGVAGPAVKRDRDPDGDYPHGRRSPEVEVEVDTT
jgi:hypothetical protein